MHQPDDTYLIQQVLQGETHAFGVLVDRYQSKVFNFVLYTLRDREEAHEVVQATFVKVHRSLNTFRNESKFSTWLLKIAYFTCMTRLRKSKPDMVGIEKGVDHHANNVAEHTNQRDMKVILSQALTHLSEEEQGIVTLFYYNEQSIKEICEITKKTESNIKIILHRSRKKLLQALNKMGITEWVL